MVASDRSTSTGRQQPPTRYVPRHASDRRPRRPVRGGRRRYLWTALGITLIAMVAAVSVAMITRPSISPAHVAAVPSRTAKPATADVHIKISPKSLGTSLTATSVGLSFEASDLLLPEFTSGNLAAYLKTLGTSAIRIGGNTVDQTFWTSSGETAPPWSLGTITDDDLVALKTLARDSGWKIVLGLNLKQYAPDRAADEAKHAVAALGSSLLAVEIGNEPDRYPQYKHNPAKYLHDFRDYVTAIHREAPGLPIDGTDAAWSDRPLQEGFVTAQDSLATPQIQSLTNHYYPLIATTCHGAPTLADLLGQAVHDDEVTAASVAAAQGKKLGVPAVIDESNNIVCEGQQGISDVFAAALWELDMQLLAARTGIEGDYQHGTVLQCDTAKPLFMYYTPLCAATAADAAAGLLAAQPEFYGLAAVHAVGTGTFLQVTNPIEAAVRTYAIKHADGTVTVVLDDVQDPSRFGPTTVQLDLGARYGSVQQVSLVASSLTATTGITLGGQTVHADGQLPAPDLTIFPTGGDSMTVTIPAGSAELLTFIPGPSGSLAGRSP